MTNFDSEQMGKFDKPPKPSDGGVKQGNTNPFILDTAKTGDDALREYLEGTDFTPQEFDDKPAFLRRRRK